MAVDFESINQVLFERIRDNCGTLINSATRNPKTWDQIPPEQQPALVMLEAEGDANRELSCPSIWTSHVEVIFYVRTPADPDQYVGTVLHQLIAKVDDALKRILAEQWGSNPETTLGGRVSRCWRMNQHMVLGLEGQLEQSLVSMTIQLVANDTE